MSVPVLPLVVVGGVGYVLVNNNEPTYQQPPPVSNKKIVPAWKIAAAQGALKLNGAGIAFATKSNPSTVDPNLQKKLDEIEAAAKKAFDDMSDVAKVEAIDKLNQIAGTNLPLDADLSWSTISMAAYGAAGAAAGAAVCGPVCGKVGALCATYLGAKLNDLIAKNWDDLKGWLNEKVWGNVKDAAEDAWDAASDAAEDAWDTVSGWNPF